MLYFNAHSMPTVPMTAITGDGGGEASLKA